MGAARRRLRFECCHGLPRILQFRLLRGGQAALDALNIFQRSDFDPCRRRFPFEEFGGYFAAAARCCASCRVSRSTSAVRPSASAWRAGAFGFFNLRVRYGFEVFGARLNRYGQLVHGGRLLVIAPNRLGIGAAERILPPFLLLQQCVAALRQCVQLLGFGIQGRFGDGLVSSVALATLPFASCTFPSHSA